MALIAILGGADSNSYVRLDYADDYFAFSPYNNQWSAFDDTAKEIALVQACRALETIAWKGSRCDPSTTDEGSPQALSWPRSGASCDGVAATCSTIPKSVNDAQCLLALNLATNPEAITGPIGGGGQQARGVYVSKNQLGDLVQEFTEYKDDSPGADCVDCATPDVIAKFPWLKDLLGCWADVGSSSSRVLLRVRS